MVITMKFVEHYMQSCGGTDRFAVYITFEKKSLLLLDFS